MDQAAGCSARTGTESRKKRVYTPLSSAQSQHLPPSHCSAAEEENVPVPEIHNIVSTSKIICIPPNDAGHHHHHHQSSSRPLHGINLEKIHEDLRNSNYDKKRFAAITIRIDNPTVTALLFTSGRLVITGSKCWYECMLASLTIVKMLKEVQPENHFYVQDCQIQNVVANVVIPGSNPSIPPDSRLNIQAMMHHLNADVKEHVCQYRKNLFPGLVYRPPNSPVVVLCFCSGRCVVTGGKDVRDVLLGWKILWKQIRRFVVNSQGRAFLDGNRLLSLH